MVKAYDIIAKAISIVDRGRLMGVEKISTEVKMLGCIMRIDWNDVNEDVFITIEKDVESELDMIGISELCSSIEDVKISVLKMNKVVNIEHNISLLRCKSIHVSKACVISLRNRNWTLEVNSELNVPFIIKNTCTFKGQFKLEGFRYENVLMFRRKCDSNNIGTVIAEADYMNYGGEPYYTVGRDAFDIMSYLGVDNQLPISPAKRGRYRLDSNVTYSEV